jgi:hypothetical protein
MLSFWRERMMGKIKFTVRVNREALEAAKHYAGQHGTTVTNLVEEFFRSLGKVDLIPHETPVLNALAGSLRADVKLDDYQAYLEKKYFDDAGK